MESTLQRKDTDRKPHFNHAGREGDRQAVASGKLPPMTFVAGAQS